MLLAANLHVVQQLVRLKAGTSLVEQTRKAPEEGFVSAEHADLADWEVQSIWPRAVDAKFTCSETLQVRQQVVESRVGACPNGQVAVGGEAAHARNLLSSQLPDKPFKVRHVGQPVAELAVGMTPVAQIGAASKLDLLHCTVPVVCGMHVGQHLLGEPLTLAKVGSPLHSVGMVVNAGHAAMSVAEHGLQLAQQEVVLKRGCTPMGQAGKTPQLFPPVNGLKLLPQPE